MNKLFFSIILAVVMGAVSCSNDTIDPNEKSSVILKFDNFVGNEALVLDSKTYKTSSGEDFSVSTFNYFVSNIELQNSDGSTFKVTDKYFLVRQKDTQSLRVTLEDIPAGDYTALSYIIGVDSLKSVSDISQRTGVLDPASYGTDNMYWSWNSGYIFMKLEGISPNSTEPNKDFKFHIGGFGGLTGPTANNLKKVELNFGGEVAKVRASQSPEIHIVSDVLKVFGSNLKISEASVIMNPTKGLTVSANYKSMFKVDHIHN